MCTFPDPCLANMTAKLEIIFRLANDGMTKKRYILFCVFQKI